MLGAHKKRPTKYWLLPSLLLLGLIIVLAVLSRGHQLPLLSPDGIVAQKQKNLMLFAAFLSLFVVIPVYAMTFGIAWKYRASNKTSSYAPDWDHDSKAETIWWLIPLILITILCVVTWRSSHDLDPFKPLASNTKPLTIQVVALEWRWLFIYPEQEIATINYVQFPEKTPVIFKITADAPMNSFWIPSLGGQMYAMSGMSSDLNLMTNKIGKYNGVSANISGAGFSGMKFVAESSTTTDFDEWVEETRLTKENLDLNTYHALAKPSKNTETRSFNLVDNDLYNEIIMKFMGHGMNTESTNMHKGTE